MTFPLYQCHKQVRAAEIQEVDASTRRIRVGYPVEGGNGTEFRSQTIMVDDAWMERFQPKAGMFLIEYAGGYRSVSPADVFLRGYDGIDDDKMDDEWKAQEPANGDSLDPDGKPATGGTPTAPSSGVSFGGGMN